jgi:hypothetical protein
MALVALPKSWTLMPSIAVTPGVAAAGDNVRVDGTGFDPRVKFALTTTDRDGLEVGISSNTNRPAKDGSFHCGIKVPPKMPCLIQAYQSAKVVACTPVQVKR